MQIKQKLANMSNYGSQRVTSSINWIVIHYTANDGDTDEGNGNYFANNVIKTSAHYFADSDSITQSVPDNYTAYAVGGNYGGGKYYGKCTNSNSISIELCDDVKNGVIYPSEKTIENALWLVRELMKKYNVPLDHVIRHYDVNGKECPKYWLDNTKWEKEFHGKIMLNGLANEVASDGNWYFYNNGNVDLTYTGLAENKNGWFYVKNGKVDFKANTIVQNSQGWWVVINGKVDFNYTGLAQNENGWFYIKNGKVDFTYTGIATNSNGSWYCEKGKVNFDKNGTFQTTVTVSKGKVM